MVFKSPFKSREKTTFSNPDNQSAGILDDYKTSKVVETREGNFNQIAIGTRDLTAGSTSTTSTLTAYGGENVVAYNTGTGNTGVCIRRTGGTASNWKIYLPSGSSSIYFYNGSNRLGLTSGGDLYLNTGKLMQLKTGTYYVILDLNTSTALGASRTFKVDVNNTNITAAFTNTGGAGGDTRVLTFNLYNADRTLTLNTSGNFTTVDGKTVTVTNGIITSIV